MNTEVSQEELQLVISYSIVKLRFAKHTHQTGYLKLSQVLNTNLVYSC